MLKQAFQFIYSGKYMSLDVTSPDKLILSSASSIGPNETFETEFLTGGSSVCVIQAANGLYLGYLGGNYVICANAESIEAIQFVQIFTETNTASLIVTALQTTTTRLLLTDATQLITTAPLDTANWPNEYSLLNVIALGQ